MRPLPKQLFLAALMVALLALAAAALERFGIVLLHGKTGMPNQFTVLAADLEDLGYAVEAPEMCWSARRIYDRSFTGCFADIDAAIERLKGDGITRVVVAGHSLGGIGALGYAATHDGLAGVIALAPDGDPLAWGRIPTIARSLATARATIMAGRGDAVATFNDVVLGRPLPVEATAADFASFFGADSPAAMTKTLPALKAPLLWVAGARDSSQRDARSLFARAPRNALNRFVTVKASHLGTPAAAFEAILDWLGEMEAR